MRIGNRLQYQAAIFALAAGALLPPVTAAQTPAAGENWQFLGAIYGYLPTIGGKTTFPVPAGGSDISVSPDKIIRNLNGAFMGSLGAHNGRWGAFTDLLYVDVGGSKSQTRDFSIGNAGIPATTSGDLRFDTKALVWTLAGQYRLQADPALNVDLFGGARMLDTTQKLNWSISGSLGPLAAAGRSGSVDVSQRTWDAIVGVKGRYAFGADMKWSVPFYLDVGTGQSDSTMQAAVGIAYAFHWGELAAMWRYLEYNMKSGKPIQEVNLNGPMVGAAWRW